MRDDIPSRRGVLRSALALGCGVWVPMLLPGCDSKNSAESGRATSPPNPAPATSTDAAPPTAPAKMAQAAVQYQQQPKGEQRCAACLHFNAASNTCQLVEGQISPNGWCILWVKKA